MLSNGLNSVESKLREHLRLPALVAAHRLDRDTSGCLLMAKTAQAFDNVLPLFRRHDVKKTYHVIAAGRVEESEQVITVPIDGEMAITRVRTLDVNRDASHLLVTIDTGRTHQIRKHLDHIRHPVIGDRHYGTRLAASDKSLRVGRQMLHASTIEFVHPETHRRVFAKAPLPRDFRNGLRTFNLT
jgi:23S rRNA-/tRNA-specific pseudouridylate synthase